SHERPRDQARLETDRRAEARRVVAEFWIRFEGAPKQPEAHAGPERQAPRQGGSTGRGRPELVAERADERARRRAQPDDATLRAARPTFAFGGLGVEVPDPGASDRGAQPGVRGD